MVGATSIFRLLLRLLFLLLLIFALRCITIIKL